MAFDLPENPVPIVRQYWWVPNLVPPLRAGPAGRSVKLKEEIQRSFSANQEGDNVFKSFQFEPRYSKHVPNQGPVATDLTG